MTWLSAPRRSPALSTRPRVAPDGPRVASGAPTARARSLGSSRIRGPALTPSPHRPGPLARAATLLLLAVASACSPEIQGSGVLREETRNLAAFAGVEVDDPIIVSIAIGPEQRVRVSGDSNVVAELETTVRTDPVRQLPVLEVRVTDEFTVVHPLRLDVTIPELRLVRAEDAAIVDVSGAGGATLAVEASDGSVVRLAGPGGARLDVSLSGGEGQGARLDASAYPVSSATVALTGGARATVRASGEVTGTAAPGCTLENVGAGLCQVTDGLGSPVSCAPR